MKQMYSIGQRTIKTAIGSGISLLIAEALHLQNYSTAAVVTLLSIQNTKRRSFIVAIQRFVASVIAMLIGWMMFEFLSYTPLTVVIYFLLTIPLLVTLKLQEGIIPSSVIVLQIYVSVDKSISFLFNQIEILAVGILIALIMNTYMPSIEKKMIESQKKIEQNFKMLLLGIALKMKGKDEDSQNELIYETKILLQTAKTLAYRQVENSFIKTNLYYINYFEMRERQFEIISNQIIPLLKKVELNYPHAKIIAEFFEDTGVYLKEKSTGIELLGEFSHMMNDFRKMPLPESRDEFETRASLMMIVYELEKVISLKMEFYSENQNVLEKQN
ncbi:aromatic acid exporter family protein [Gottfriedia acidiceleris]|uniref:aromatic acid exporter family protein n=1 Tax=Gottfriedia acidiceleris TaxID=371036 RepID=UPI0014303900|nr:aromatic acid exporter family protein [Gottfriedia acidiceleris]